VTGLVLRFAPFLAGAALLSVLVHVLTLLSLPYLATRTAGQRLARLTDGTAVTVLAPSRPGADVLPFTDPAMVTALCAFDLAEGPFRIRTQTGEAFLSITVLSPVGRVLQSLSDKAAVRRILDVVLVTDPQLRALEAQDPEDEAVQELRLRLPSLKGTVMIKAFAPRPSDADAAKELLGRTQCRTMQDG
jgi:uncharacterized membrane protein